MLWFRGGARALLGGWRTRPVEFAKRPSSSDAIIDSSNPVVGVAGSPRWCIVDLVDFPSRQRLSHGAHPNQYHFILQVVIVGRPNVGKSALFNRLVGRKAALVQNTPGGHVTRDWKEGSARLGDLDFTVVDTSGLEPELGTKSPHSIQARTAVLTASVLARADATLLLMDGR